MDPRLLKYYNRELQQIREMGAEFAEEFPKIAGRLSLDGLVCADPYVERLLEGFAFLAARVQLKIDAEFPAFTQHLLEMVYPYYLAPTPSMAVMHLEVDRAQGIPAEGFEVERGTVLRSAMLPGEQTACEFRTGHDLTLWPIEIAGAEYLTHTGDVARLELSRVPECKAGLRMLLRSQQGLPFSKIGMDRLSLHLGGGDETQMRLYEALIGGTVEVIVRDGKSPGWQVSLGPESVRRGGFADDEALLPYGMRAFHGYRLLREYFSFPARFMFVDVEGLRPALRRCESELLELVFLLRGSDAVLSGTLDASDFELHCTPAINLFPRRADRIHLDERQSEYHIVPDRTRPLDFEVYSVEQVTGHGTSADAEQEFLPFYRCDERLALAGDAAFYTLERRPRMVPSAHLKGRSRSSYGGSEVFITLVDGNQAPYSPDLRQLSLELLCTNRDLVERLAAAGGTSEFTLQSGAPVSRVRCLAGPTSPKRPAAEGMTAWKLISHLSLNYLSLVDNDSRQGAAALREMLRLYGDTGVPAIEKQIEGLRSVGSKPVVRRLPESGPIAFGRGLEIRVEFDEAAFEGSGVFLLGAVLEEFFARYVSINSFTETVIVTTDRGEIMRWPVRTGRRHRL